MNKNRIRALCECGIFASLIAVFSQIAIPMPAGVPITLQTFIVALSSYYSGYKKGFASYLVYLSVGLMGMPVFSSFQGGVSALLGLTGGFLIGFVPFSFLIGFGKNQKRIKAFTLGFLSLIILHLSGVIFYMFIAKSDFISAFLVISLPYLLKDYLSIILSFEVSKILIKRIKL